MMENLPLVSVIIPSYNHEEYICACIRSIIDQDYENVELIVIDDGSSDASALKIREMIPECESRFVRFEFRVRANRGLCATLNEAIEWCHGEFIAVTASDDLSLPNRLSVQMAFMVSNAEVGVCSAGVVKVDEKGKELKELVLPRSTTYTFDDIINFDYFMPAPALFFRAEILTPDNIFDKRFVVEDFYILLKLSSLGFSLHCIDQVLAKYRIHDTNTSKRISYLADGRRAIISEFTSGSAYKRAIAISDIIASTQLLPESRLKALKFFYDTISYDPRLILTLRFVRFGVLFFMPKLFVKRLLSL